eukprot:gnl/MRDRNA2_/MRDRNA2_344535_c0_seq1.p1 gnl/MRDRNA2_/MRDRNA2_344535_c0~~gnl/MRDRNA2_/MRDRNA2_344535_c0_seq1.p1  ORF type:complete len:140 (+),score=22.20 gnl/MRDRNA2_/MRDRNA2_344535_c0_seq1:141-560(+)
MSIYIGGQDCVLERSRLEHIFGERHFWDMLTPALQRYADRLGDPLRGVSLVRLHFDVSIAILGRINTQQLNVSVNKIAECAHLALVSFLERLREQEQFREALHRFGTDRLESILETFIPDFLNELAEYSIRAMMHFSHE